MSHLNPTNPYASPTAPPQPAKPTASAFKPIDKIEYMRMYNYVFENPSWLTTVLLSALCLIIPVIGPLVLLGFQYEVVISLLATQGLQYPAFDFNRFGDYLMRGVWPFLVQLVASVVIVPLVFILFGIPLFILLALGAAMGEENGSIVLGIGMPLLMIVLIPLSALPAVLLIPFMLRAGLTQDFAEGFNWNWAVDFLKTTWRELFLAMLFLIVTGGVLAMLGMLACYIGMFVAMPVVFLAQAHLLYQVYGLFLTRGGSPVPVKVAVPQMTGQR